MPKFVLKYNFSDRLCTQMLTQNSSLNKQLELKERS